MLLFADAQIKVPSVEKQESILCIYIYIYIYMIYIIFAPIGLLTGIKPSSSCLFTVGVPAGNNIILGSCCPKLPHVPSMEPGVGPIIALDTLPVACH